MKRRMAVTALVITMLAALFVGCSSNNDNNAGQTNNGNNQGQKDTPKNDPPKQVTIKYVNWNLGTEADNNIERKMIQAFQDSHPNIKIELDESFDYSKYIDSLVAAAAASELPDVIMLPNIPLGLSNEWLANINDLALGDPEWNNLPKTLEQATHYGNGVYAVPAGLFFSGYFINQDLFEDANLPELNFAPTWDEFFNAIKTLNNASAGVVGLAEEVQIPEWYPSSVKPELGWYAWDGQSYHLNDQAFSDGVNKAKQLFQGKYTYDSLSDDQKAQYNAGWYGEVWDQGKIAVRWDGTWSANQFKGLNFNSKFIGTPGGRFTLIGDFMGISSSSKNPAEAYEFAKYMTFGKEGILKRIELNTDGSYTSLPLTTDQSVLDQYFANGAYDGLQEAYEHIDNAIVEGVKIVPGYVKSRWEATTGVKIGDKENANLSDLIWNSMRGDVKIQDYADQINKLANDEYKNAADAISVLTK